MSENVYAPNAGHANMKPTDNFYLRYGVNLFQECMQGGQFPKESGLTWSRPLTRHSYFPQLATLRSSS